MKHPLLILYFALLMLGCDRLSDKAARSLSKDQKRIDSQVTDPKFLPDEATIALIKFIVNNHYDRHVEIHGLYPQPGKILQDSTESAFIAAYLKVIGFKQTDWSRGNWVGGPRIVSYFMERSDCRCQVDKLYYSPELEGSYRTTERIFCKMNDSK